MLQPPDNIDTLLFGSVKPNPFRIFFDSASYLSQSFWYTYSDNSWYFSVSSSFNSSLFSKITVSWYFLYNSGSAFKIKSHTHSSFDSIYISWSIIKISKLSFNLL